MIMQHQSAVALRFSHQLPVEKGFMRRGGRFLPTSVGNTGAVPLRGVEREVDHMRGGSCEIYAMMMGGGSCEILYMNISYIHISMYHISIYAGMQLCPP